MEGIGPDGLLLPSGLGVDSAATGPRDAATAAMTLDEANYVACRRDVLHDPARGLVIANEWLTREDGPLVRQCLGLAHMGLGEAGPAAIAFAAGAALVPADQPLAAELWVQAGNAALAAGDAATARNHLAQAIAAGTLAPLALGEAHIDRARAEAALEEWAAARADLDIAQRLPSTQDPVVWLLSATLARRQGDLTRAQADIQQAALLDPRNSAVALEAGNIAAAAGRYDAARQSWMSAVTLGRTDQSASVARARLIQLDAIEREAAAPAEAAEAAPAPQSR